MVYSKGGYEVREERNRRTTDDVDSPKKRSKSNEKLDGTRLPPFSHRGSTLCILLSGLCDHSPSSAGACPSIIIPFEDGWASSSSESSSPARFRRVELGVEAGGFKEAVRAAASAERVAR